jgi:hypothetical protein
MLRMYPAEETRETAITAGIEEYNERKCRMSMSL